MECPLEPATPTPTVSAETPGGGLSEGSLEQATQYNQMSFHSNCIPCGPSTS